MHNHFVEKSNNLFLLIFILFFTMYINMVRSLKAPCLQDIRESNIGINCVFKFFAKVFFSFFYTFLRTSSFICFSITFKMKFFLLDLSKSQTPSPQPSTCASFIASMSRFSQINEISTFLNALFLFTGHTYVRQLNLGNKVAVIKSYSFCVHFIRMKLLQ